MLVPPWHCYGSSVAEMQCLYKGCADTPGAELNVNLVEQSVMQIYRPSSYYDHPMSHHMAFMHAVVLTAA